MQTPLPAPIYIPPAPDGARSYGGSRMPVLRPESDPGAPQIAAVSESCREGETIAMTGENLDGARFAFWTERFLQTLDPIMSKPNRALLGFPGNPVRAGVALVWPVKDGKYGRPIRVGGPAAWWCWPERLPAGRKLKRVQIYGKNFVPMDTEPHAYLKGTGPGVSLKLTVWEPYHLEARLPDGLEPGEYQIWIHNGSGAEHGWSDPLTISVESANAKERPVLNIDDFGAKPNSDMDATEAIRAALAKANETGGGILRFSPGVYTVTEPIRVDIPHVRFEGAGKGSYDWATDALSGEYTCLRCVDETKPTTHVIEIHEIDCEIRDMTLRNGNDGRKQIVVGVYAAGAAFENARFIMYDRRDWGFEQVGPPPWPQSIQKAPRKPGSTETGQRYAVQDYVERKIGVYRSDTTIDTGAIFINTHGEARALICGCEFQTAGPGVLVGVTPAHEAKVPREVSSDGIFIYQCVFRGHYAGEPSGLATPAGSGRAVGVIVYNGKKVAVEQCDFASADRQKRRVMCRTSLSFNTANRFLYYGNNISRNVGSHPSAEGMHFNQGEQYLLHWRYPHGGLFNVVEASDTDLVIDPADVKTPTPEDPTDPHQFWSSAHSQIPSEVGQNRHWILFVCKGRGVGQFREIVGKEEENGKVRFIVDKPWRVDPDHTSRVNLICAYRNIILYRNYVDTGILQADHKSHGVTFWFYAFDNIVANNIFKNMTAGVVWNSRFRGPNAWNVTRENVVENITGFAGDTSLKPAIYVDHFRVSSRWPEKEDEVWYSVGNLCVNNQGRNADVGAYLHTRYSPKAEGALPAGDHEDGGIVMSIIENSEFRDVKEGIVVSAPVTDCLIRKSLVTTIDPDAPKIIDQDGKGRKGIIEA